MTKIERVQQCFQAMAPVTGVPQIVLSYLGRITDNNTADWLEAIAKFIRFSAETSASRRLVDVWAAYYLAGYLTLEQYADGGVHLLGPWQPLTEIPLSDDERSALYELGEETTWSNPNDIIGTVR